MKAVLVAVGFHQIGPLIGFHATTLNRKLLLSLLQLLVSMSNCKSPALLHKLDVNLLGVPPPADKDAQVSWMLICWVSLLLLIRTLR